MVKNLILSAFALLYSTETVFGDIYIQSIRGSNNRLDEQGRGRANGNRLFDSQNNDRGGYNVGHMTFYTGEKIPISWTNQHGAGRYQLKETELILQYSCDPLMRDGSSTQRIPTNPVQCANFDCDRDVEYGRHESLKSYQYCRATYRNKGLFTANQDLNGNSAIYTRQDSNGNQYGYECPEERDYYPYWRSSMWRDLAILTNTPQRCSAYREESQNRKSRWECRYVEKYWEEVLGGYYLSNSPELPLDQFECENHEDGLYVPEPDENGERAESYYKFEWVEVPAYDIPPPDCKATVTTRANHHGLPGTRSFWTYDWEVPDSILDIPGHDHCCVIRLRYNITTNDYPAWEAPDSIGPGVDYRNNSLEDDPNANDDPAWIRIWDNFGLTYEDVEYSFTAGANDEKEQRLSRGYVFRNDPEVDPFGIEPFAPDGNPEHASRILLQLAIATDQFGRTFEDRTHCFSVRDREEVGVTGRGVTNDITLVTVQGKRGNIVQVYPATEYFFVPEPAVIYENSYVHFCWTGSNRNPNNNAGQGQAGSDRSNICPLTQPQWDKSDYGNVDNYWQQRLTDAVGDPGNNYPDWISEPSYGLPVYYNYAHKRDVSRRSRMSGATSSNAESWWSDHEDVYPYNDPYNSFWFSERGSVSPMAGLDTEVLSSLCTGRGVSTSPLSSEIRSGTLDYGNMDELDDAGTTFCIEPVQVKTRGTWHFLSTRNNNFSNRSQKGSLVVSNAFSESYSVTTEGIDGQTVEGQAKIVVLPQFVHDGDSLDFSVTTWLNRGETSTIVQLTGPDGGAFTAQSLTENGWIEIWIPYTPKSLAFPRAWQKHDIDHDWKEHSRATVKYEEKTHFAVIQVQDGGYYTITNEPDPIAYIACIIGSLLFCCSLGFVVKKNCVRK